MFSSTNYATVSELTTLDSPSESNICDVLKARLLSGEIYTGVSAMLLAVNPCEWLSGLYSERAIQRYLGSEPNPPPHVFRTAANMHRGMSQDGRSQSVVISGESGAGKTQTFKRMMQFISAACEHNRAIPPVNPRTPANLRSAAMGSGTSVEALLIETVPILEAYGNATTPHNPDSSRFGKFVVLHFKQGGALAGIAVRTYLLETTRAVTQGEGERGFHVFHELLAGGRAQALKAASASTPTGGFSMTPAMPNTPALSSGFLDEALAREEAEDGGTAGGGGDVGTAGDEAPDMIDLLGFNLLLELRLDPMPPTRFLTAAAQSVPTERDDANRFQVLLSALEAADIHATDARELFRATAACLHLGAIGFVLHEERRGGSEGTTHVPDDGVSKQALEASADLLGVDAAALLRALTCKQVKAGNEWIEKSNPPHVCLELCEALAKAVYAKVFAWLQVQLSAALAARSPDMRAAGIDGVEKLTQLAPLSIGLLDIFGFEIFELNSLEQLCINFANEKLQGLFNQVMVLHAQQESLKEGIPSLNWTSRA